MSRRIVGQTGLNALSDNGSTVTSTESLTFPTAIMSGKVTTYNGQTTAGEGVSAVLAITSQKSETGADAAVLSYTPAAAAGSYRISISWSVQTATSAVIGWTATWTDSSGVAKAPTNMSLFQVGTAAPALTFTAGTGTGYYATANIDVDNSATAIVVKTTMGTGTLTASKLTAIIERLN